MKKLFNMNLFKRIVFNQRGSVGAEDSVNEETTTDSTNETQEEQTEDVLYGEDQQPEEPVDNDQEKTEASEDSEKEEPVAEDKEKEGQEETDDSAEDKEGDKYDYKLEVKEESVVSADMVGEIEAFAKENKLSEEQATQLLGTQEKLINQWAQSELEKIEAEKDGWREQVINDKYLGGDNFNTTVANAKKVVQRFGSKEFITLLEETGYGDHPEVVRLFSGIGKLMTNDSLVKGGDFGGSNRTAEEIFYGNN